MYEYIFILWILSSIVVIISYFLIVHIDMDSENH